MRLIRYLAVLCTALAVGFGATASWAQEGPPSPTPTGSATPSPSPGDAATPSPTPSPSPTDGASPTPSPGPSPTVTPGPASPSPSVDPTPRGVGGEVTLEVTASRTALRVGQEMTVDVVVTNGTDTPADLTLQVELPEQLGYVSSEPPGQIVAGGPPPAGDAVGIDIGTVPAGTSAGPVSVTLAALSAAPPGGVEVWFGISGDETSSPEVLVVEVLDNEGKVSGALTLEASAPSVPVAEVGDHLTYTLTVTNTSEDILEDVIVVERVAPEVRVIGAPLVEGVDAVQIGRFLDKEDIVWVMEELDPGESLRLPWRGAVQAAGDLEVTTSARATAARAEPVTASAANFLASPEAPAGPVNPPFTPIRKRVAIQVPADLPGQGTLPLTGLAAWGWSLIGAAIVLIGLTLYRFGSPLAKGKRVPAALLLVSIMAAACVSTSDPEQKPQAGGTPEVKGQRIERGNPDNTPQDEERQDRSEQQESGEGPNEDGGPGNDRASSGGDDGDDSRGTAPGEVPEVVPPGDDPDLAPPPIDPGTVTRIVVREVMLSDLPVRTAPSASGSSASFGWDEPSRTMTTRTSSIMYVESSPVAVVTTMHDDGGSISAEVSLLNESNDERVAVQGHLVHEIGENGRLARLTSDPIDTVLSPGGRVTATFRYLLPSGTYQAGGSFVSV